MVRLTPMEEVDRINDRLFRESKFEIQDRDSYDLAFNDLLSLTEKDLSSKQKGLRNDGFGDYLNDHPEVSEERLFTKVGKGKDLRRDRLKTAKKVVRTKEKFRGKASIVDLAEFDTRTQKVTKEITRRRRFNIPAKVKGRVVFAVKTSVVVMGKSQVRFRNSKGQFSSIKK